MSFFSKKKNLGPLYQLALFSMLKKGLVVHSLSVDNTFVGVLCSLFNHFCIYDDIAFFLFLHEQYLIY